jgi:hypothetical protein
MGVIDCESNSYTTTVLDIYNSVVMQASINASLGLFGRNGGSALRISTTNSSNISGRVAKTLPGGPYPTIFYGFGLRTSSLFGTAGSFFIFFEMRDAGTTQVDLRLLSDGTIRVTRNGSLLGTTGVALLPNTYYWIDGQLTVHNTAGVISVRVNEATALNLTGQNTRSTANNYVSEITHAHGVVTTDTFSSRNVDFADRVIRDDQLPGDRQVKRLLMLSDDVIQWIRNGGLTNASRINEIPRDDSTYNGNTNVGDQDTFTAESIANSSIVDAVRMLFRADKQDAGSASFAPVIKSGGTSYPGSNLNPSLVSPAYLSRIYNVHPVTGVAFTPSNINNDKYGYRRTV